MDKLFRKRAASSAGPAPAPATGPIPAPVHRPSTLKKPPSSHAAAEAEAVRRMQANESRERSALGDVAPTIDLDVRISLIFPELSQRFSVLLPSLTSAPETSLRSLLASQRARHAGPSITEEEEELVLAELRDASTQWDGQPPDRDWSFGDSSRLNTSYSTRSLLTSSSSSPSVLGSFDASSQPTSAGPNTSSSWTTSPPPTSTSFSSFKTFGYGESSGTKVKSYGFSGGSSLREEEYIRRAKKSASGRNLPGSLAGRKDSSRALNVSPVNTRANTSDADIDSHSSAPSDHFHNVPSESGTSLSDMRGVAASDTSATPASPSHRGSHDSPPQAPLPSLPHSPAPFDSLTMRPLKRQSRLAGMTPAQMKRISAALVEVGGKLQHGPSPTESTLPEHQAEEEEVLEAVVESYHGRRSSDAKSDTTTTSHSTAFPFTVSPTGSNLASSNIEPPSPSRLPPSPRSHNLLAHIHSDIQPAIPPPALDRRADIPRPILTPSRTRPLRRTPSETASQSPASPDQPIYIPGQPRPIRMVHRSEGSMSSRSATPTQSGSSPIPAATHHARSDSASSLLAQPAVPLRHTSLSKTRPSNLTPQVQRLPNSSSTRETADLFSTVRLDSPLSVRPLTPADTIEEAEEMSHTGLAAIPEIQMVQGWRKVAAAKQAVDRHGEDGRRSPGRNGRLESHEGVIGGSIGTPSPSPHPEHAGQVREISARSSFSSTFDENESEDKAWKELPSGSPPVNSNPGVDTALELFEALRKVCGMGIDELTILQAKLVENAQSERRELRALAESPIPPASPNLPTKQVPSLSRGSSPTPVRATSPPPTAWRHPEIIRRLSSNAAPTLGNLQSAVESAEPHDELTGAPSLATTTHPTPAEQKVSTPTTDASVGKAPQRTQTAPEDDPAVRRDFEARIAAATAALHRTPSISQGAKMERKYSKRGGPLVISGPKLMSSSTNLPASPVTPPTIDPDIHRALDKASGGKRSRWKKLGFRKGSSITGTKDLSPSTSSPPVPSAPSRLQAPIALNSGGQTQGKAELDSFRFPSSENSTANGSTLPSPPQTAKPLGGAVVGESQKYHLMSEQSPLIAQEPRGQTPVSLHARATSTDSALSKFVEAGRALGLKDEHLNEMLKSTSPLLDRSGTSGSSTSYESTGLTSISSPNADHGSSTVATHASVAEVTDKQGDGLVRNPSKTLKQTLRMVETTLAPEDRNRVVRRTLLVPTLTLPPPNGNQDASAASSSPDRPAPARKLSIRRKPLNLTAQDQELVLSSPSRERKFSDLSSSKSSEDRNPASDLLRPTPPISAHRTSDERSIDLSSNGGSLYDLYRDTGDEADLGEEILDSPSKEDGGATAPGLEICELEDGRMVWSVVDGLRAPVGEDDALSLHSRHGSYASDAGLPEDGADGMGIWGKGRGVAALNFRHRDRRQTLTRPPTNVYFASRADMADLIDQISGQDVGAARGRIDILPYEDQNQGQNPAFEDAPSPRRSPFTSATAHAGHLASATVPAGGFSPKRQLFFRQGGGMGSAASSSPTAAGFASSGNGLSGRTVEDRLQALLDRLKVDDIA